MNFCISFQYIARAFIRNDALDGKLGESISDDKRWMVQRLRRRARSRKERKDKESKDIDTTGKSSPKKECSTDESVDNSVIGNLVKELDLGVPQPSANNVDVNIDKKSEALPKTAPVKNENVVSAEKLLFGFSLGKHHLTSIELDSDQESTDGEEEAMQLGETRDRLTPDWLLWYVYHNGYRQYVECVKL